MSRRSRFTGPIPPALLTALRAQLAEGERLAWAGHPEPLALEPAEPDTGKWEAAGILGGGYAVLGGGVMAFRTGQWLWMSLPISLFVLALGGYFIAKWFKARALKAVEGTAYGVSTRRALIVQTYPALVVKALPIEAITDVTLSELPDDFGDLHCCVASAASPGLVFRGLDAPERARAQIMRVIRDPQAADQEIATAEAYAMQMRQLNIGRM